MARGRSRGTGGGRAAAVAAGAGAAGLPSISNLAACIEDARLAGLDADRGPSEPADYHQLLGRLQTSRVRLPPLYISAVYDPFAQTLQQLGPSGFVNILMQDPARERAAGLMLDIAQSILQNGEGYEERATDAFEEVVSDLYDGFLSAEDRRGVEPPDLGTIAPLVKWGNPDFGPYTWPIDATSNFGLQCAVVSLPPANTRSGILGWSTLGHETAGHDILHADTGLKAELVDKVQSALIAANGPALLPDYWSTRIDETASDVLGLLNMGPAAGIGLIGYFRGLGAAFGAGPRLRSTGPASDPHPADVLRGFLAASTIRLLKFQGAAGWAKVIETETLADVTSIVLEGVPITTAEAQKSADVVAAAIVGAKLAALENHALGEIQNWRDGDEEIVASLRQALASGVPLPQVIGSGVFAAHAVAAATYAAVAGDAPLALIMDRMLAMLKAMHDANPSWGPLFVRHPGSLVADRAYIRHP